MEEGLTFLEFHRDRQANILEMFQLQYKFFHAVNAPSQIVKTLDALVMFQSRAVEKKQINTLFVSNFAYPISD